MLTSKQQLQLEYDRAQHFNAEHLHHQICYEALRDAVLDAVKRGDEAAKNILAKIAIDEWKKSLDAQASFDRAEMNLKTLKSKILIEDTTL